jgi:hypothetical protein
VSLISSFIFVILFTKTCSTKADVK